jgi:Subtilase family/Fibronectin type-III domain/Peptidase inhibitor I9
MPRIAISLVLLALALLPSSAGADVRVHAGAGLPAAATTRLPFAGSAAQQLGAKKAPGPDQWIVELDAAPLARHAPSLDVRSASARVYVAELDDRQAAALRAAAPGVKPDVSYRTAFAGFAARLTDAQAQAMRSAPGVRRVTRERFFHVDSAQGQGGQVAGSEASLLGVPDGLWKSLGGRKRAGAGVIVGFVDTGVEPGLPSFSDAGLQAPPSSWHGTCQTGPGFPASSCNNKLIGARYFVDGFGPGNVPPDALSPRDFFGHGTHVSASAVGDYGVSPAIGANRLGVKAITGIAPAAYMAMYKACWDFCSDVDLVAAIDQAVADGVDVINFSIGGQIDPDDPVDPVQLALLNADAAGVFTSVSAGNEGASRLALGSPAAAPWTTAVAATSASRTFRTTVDVTGPGANVSFPASTIDLGQRDVPVVDARTLPGDHDGSDFDPRYCWFDIDPAAVAGKVVLCDGGNIPTFIIDQVLREAGAKGAIIPVDQADDPIVRLQLPFLVASKASADALRRLVAAGPTTISYGDGTATAWQPDRVAWFSSRGPSRVTGDLLRPDIAAPGVNVLSAFAPCPPCGPPHDTFGVLSGTSMAAPQVAGSAALLHQAHPGWTPAQIRSALVTTARPTLDSDGTGPAPHEATGGGRIDPNAAAEAGLVIAPTDDDYRGYAESVDPGTGRGHAPLAAKDLNMPSIALDGAVEPITVRRTVTSVASSRATWSVDAPRHLSVTPARFTIAAGASQTLTIRFDPGDDAAKAFQDGAIVLHDAATGSALRLATAIHDPGVVDPPAQLDIRGAPADGSRTITMPIVGTVSGVASGLAEPDIHADQITTHDDKEGLERYILPIDVPAGTAYLAATRKVTDGDPFDDELLIFRDTDGDGRFSGGDLPVTPFEDQPPNGTSDDKAFPEPGRYFVAYAADAAGPIHLDAYVWLVHDAKPDDPDPAPGLVLAGDPQKAFGAAAARDFELRWNGVGTLPLRGLVAWYSGTAADPRHLLATTVVTMEPGRP